MRLLPVRALLFWFSLVGCGVATAQVDVQIRLEKRDVLAGEPVRAEVIITNRAGRDLTLADHDRTSWLGFVVKDSRDQPVTVRGRPTFPPVTIGTGQSVSRTMEISRLFRLNELGSYAVTAVVRPSPDPRQAFMSNRHTFNVTSGRTLWSQRIGMGTASATREYRLLSFRDDHKTHLYVQLVDGELGVPLTTFALGEVLLFRPPQAAVDGQRNLHALQLVSPTLWMRTTVSPEGQVVGRDLYKRGHVGDPRMVTFGDGTVEVQGGIPHNPAAEQEARSKVRRLSERPN